MKKFDKAITKYMRLEPNLSIEKLKAAGEMYATIEETENAKKPRGLRELYIQAKQNEKDYLARKSEENARKRAHNFSKMIEYVKCVPFVLLRVY